ncbi:MAG: hypothetical protein M3Y28_07065, partial [Armatimonadota bacterium]|nr:hypothetical protein [Armatimonadota bacterium]
DALASLEALDPDEERAYVLIQPDPTPPEYQARLEPFTALGRRDDQTPVTQVIGAVYDALREQSFDKDLHGSQKVNLRLEAREKFLPWVMQTVTMAVTDVPAAQQEVRAQLDGLLDGQGSRKSADDAVARYQAKLASESAVKQVLDGLPDDRKYLFLLGIVLADYIAGLEEHHPIRIERIFPQKADRLAGKKLGHFGGFLKPELMRYDFICGLGDAYRWLYELAGRRGWEEPLASVMQEMDLQIDPEAERLATTPWAGMPKDLKEHFFDLVIGRAADFGGEEANAGPAGRRTLDGLAHLLEIYLKFTMRR